MKDNSVRSLRWKLFLLGVFKIPVIGFCRPKLMTVDQNSISIRIPFRRRTRNHVGSMYLGVMTVGADLASGLLAFYLAEQQGLKIAPVFSGMKAEYLKRAEGDVDFVCKQGQTILNMIEEAKQTKERVTENIVVQAFCLGEEVARFEMGLSIKSKLPSSTV
jgi:Domain of unknown function (DUF4442)